MKQLEINKGKKFSEFFDAQNSPRKIDFLILHHIEADSAKHAIKQLCEHKVSSHFIIDEEGKIFELVSENDIAYHAGVSFWHGFEGLNKNSIGIEFINSSPFAKKFATVQMQAGVELCQYLIKKYHIEAENILGHSDVAYDSVCGFLDRKQDPSHFFDWKFFAENNVGIFPQISLSENEDKKLFELGNKDSAIKEIKNKLRNFGYKITNFSEEFDLEMQLLTRVFHRHFNQTKFSDDCDFWYLSSSLILDDLILRCQKSF
jgi:N-acetylmuramoyl-L-alanine amidase